MPAARCVHSLGTARESLCRSGCVPDGVILRGAPQLFGEAHGGLADDDLRVRALMRDLVAIQSSGTSQVARVEEAFVALATRIESGSLPHALEQLIDALLPLRLDKLAEQAHARRGSVVRRRPVGRGGAAPGDFGLVAEITSPATRKTDLFAKPGEYAEAGIPLFWRIDIEPELAVYAFRLEDGRYSPAAEARGAGGVCPAPRLRGHLMRPRRSDRPSPRR